MKVVILYSSSICSNKAKHISLGEETCLKKRKIYIIIIINFLGAMIINDWK